RRYSRWTSARKTWPRPLASQRGTPIATESAGSKAASAGFAPRLSSTCVLTFIRPFASRTGPGPARSTSLVARRAEPDDSPAPHRHLPPGGQRKERAASASGARSERKRSAQRAQAERAASRRRAESHRAGERSRTGGERSRTGGERSRSG